MVRYDYNVTDTITGETKYVIIPPEDIELRYGKLTAPTKIFIKAYACSMGLFPWAHYTKLTVERALY